VIAGGKTLELYGTNGPASRLSSYGYYRLMAWRAFEIGASAVGFWAFSDTGGAPSAREYLAPRTSFSPLSIEGNEILPTRHLYAIREGVEDYEYLALVTDAIAREAPRRPPADPAIAAARLALDTAMARTLGGVTKEAYYAGRMRARNDADAVRLDLAAALQRLTTPGHAPR
jgi:hypothetical protein